MHVQPLRDNDADDHNLMLSTLTDGHGIFTAQAEPQDDCWYDPDDDWYDPLPGAGSNVIHFQNLDEGYGAFCFDALDRYVWASLKPADDNTSVAIMAHLDELKQVARDPVVFWNSQDQVFEIYFRTGRHRSLPCPARGRRLGSRSRTRAFNSLTLARHCTSFPITLSTPWWLQLRRLRSSCRQ